jgi:predicted glycogen debranching enzyme
MTIEIDGDVTQDFARATALEWLETDGLGGSAGSTVAGAHRRRDHGLLAVGSAAGGARALLAKLDEALLLGGQRVELGCNQFPGAIWPRGFEHLSGFRRDLFPEWEYTVAGVRLRKTVAAVEGESTLLVLYEVLAAPAAPVVIELRPFAALRAPHLLCRARRENAPAITLRDDTVELGFPGGRELTIFIRVPLAVPLLSPDWWYRFELESERRRSLDYEEDLWTPGVFRAPLTAGGRLGVILSAADPAGRDPFELLERERERREKLLQLLPIQDEITRALGLAADQFVMRRGAAGRGVMAGYPGGSDATSDALIALPGLLLATGRHDDARKVLRVVARGARDGVLADHLSGERREPAEPAAATLDTSLWLFPAAQRYLRASGDQAFVAETLLPLLREIVARHESGTPAGLRVAPDGLLAAPADAARPGKAVEINALWHNALATLAELESTCGDTARGTALAQRARRVAKRFGELFFRSGEGALFDSVQDGERDPTVRAHHVLAVGLPYSALSKTRALRLLETLEERLHTPSGLRDRAGAEPAGLGGNEPDGNAEEGSGQAAGAGGSGRSAAAAVAWPWLLGPFLSALARFQGPAGRRQALELLVGLDPQLAGGCVGTVAEAVTAEPPYLSCGRVAQAMSVAELLRVYVEDLAPAPTPAKSPAPRPRPKPKTKRAAPAVSAGGGRTAPPPDSGSPAAGRRRPGRRPR